MANIDNTCAYVYFHEHEMFRAVMADFLLQRSRTPLLRKPHFLLSFALLSVRVDVERASCCFQQGIEKVIMNVILSVGEAAHDGRILDELYKMHIFLCWAFWRIFRLSPWTLADLASVDAYMKSLCPYFYRYVFGGHASRLSLCHSAMATLLDLIPCMCA